MMPWARVRSGLVNQSVNALVKFGKHPASPAPNMKRVTHSEAKFQAQPVAAVKTDHHSTTRMSTLRGPSQSPSRPPGISQSA